MPLFDRLRTSLRADAHGVIDALEDRALLLKQHLRDAELEVQRKRARAVELAAEQARLAEEATRVQREQERQDQDADLALSEGRDELARKALARALPLAQLTRRIRERSEHNQREQRALESVLATQESELVALRTRVEAFLAAQASARADGPSFVPAPVSDDQVEIELLRRKRAQRAPAGAGGTGPEEAP
jgi:phage shock protein A